MKIKLTIFIILNTCIFNLYAFSLIELRCSYITKGSNKSTEVIKDSSGVTTWSGQPKEDKYNEKYVSYIKITTDNKNYFKYESGETIYSTKDEESVFNGWSKADMDVKVKSNINENTIFIVANMYSNKFGEMRVFERIEIDRISGEYKEISNSNSTIGVIKVDEKMNFLTSEISSFEKNGKCEKFIRKF